MTANARVLVVEHQIEAGLGSFESVLRHSGLDVYSVGPETGREVPHSLAGFDALIVLGGSMGPGDDDQAPWLPATRALLAAGVAEEVPTLGICLGAQLMTAALGGHIREIPDGPEIGLNTVEFSGAAAQDPLLGGLSRSAVPVVQWHWLEADRLPSGAQLLASSRVCQNQAFRVGSCAWGLQFHPEALSQTAQEWADMDADSLAQLGITADEVVVRVREADTELSKTWTSVAARFANLVLEKTAHNRT